MIAPVPPVSNIAPAPVVAPDVNPVHNVGAAMPATPPAPPEPALVDRFAALMQQVGHSPAGQPRTHGPSQLHRMINAEDQAARATLDEVRSFSIGDVHSPAEAAAAVMQMQTEMAVLSFKLNVVNTLAESGKTSVQTLMKNQ